jgi:membrane protease YdiL (CAAX protease family)
MNTLSAFIHRRPVLAYFALVFVISWGGGALVVGPSHVPLDWERFERLGAAFFAVSLAGPVLAGLLLTGILDGRAGARELMARLGKWRVSTRWYGLAVLPAIVMAGTLLALAFVSPDFALTIFTSANRVNTVAVGVVLGLMFGLEEIGWTGFAVPRLRRRYGIVSTGVMVGLAWGTWHFPLFWQADSFSAPLPFTLLLVHLFSWLPPFRILLVWIHDRTGSLPLPMLMHGCVSAVSVVLVSAAPSPAVLWTVTLAWPVMMWLLVMLLTVASHGHLTRSLRSADSSRGRRHSSPRGLRHGTSRAREWRRTWSAVEDGGTRRTFLSL